MSIFKIILGDYSGDGHGVANDFFVETTGPYQYAELSLNYSKAVRKTGVKPEKFDDLYGDGMFGTEVYPTLRAHGYVPSSEWLADEWDCEGKGFLTDDLAIDLIMFLVSYNLPDFTWKRVLDDTPVLVAGVGYGMYLM